MRISIPFFVDESRQESREAGSRSPEGTILASQLSRCTPIADFELEGHADKQCPVKKNRMQGI
jgi:hypothetical protein